MKVAVVGSRDFAEPLMVGAIIDNLADSAHAQHQGLTVFSGGARGVDTLVREACVELDFHVCAGVPFDEPIDGDHFVEYLAIWRAFGKLDRGAGYKRNRRIVSEVDMVVALFAPGPRSPGTSHTVQLAVEKGVPVHIFHEGVWTRG